MVQAEVVSNFISVGLPALIYNTLATFPESCHAATFMISPATVNSLPLQKMKGNITAPSPWHEGCHWCLRCTLLKNSGKHCFNTWEKEAFRDLGGNTSDNLVCLTPVINTYSPSASYLDLSPAAGRYIHIPSFLRAIELRKLKMKPFS